jgi:hypothetical protein
MLIGEHDGATAWRIVNLLAVISTHIQAAIQVTALVFDRGVDS